MTRHCPNCGSTNLFTTLMVSDNDAGCNDCQWNGKESDLEIKKTLADRIMDRIAGNIEGLG